MRTAIFAFALMTTTTGAFAQSRQSTDQVRSLFNNFAHENVVCAAYYAVTQACLNKTPKFRETAERTGKAFEQAMRMARLATKRAGLMEQTVQSRLELSSGEMIKGINQDCGNISILMNRHLNQCRDLLEHPDRSLRVVSGQNRP